MSDVANPPQWCVNAAVAWIAHHEDIAPSHILQDEAAQEQAVALAQVIAEHYAPEATRTKALDVELQELRDERNEIDESTSRESGRREVRMTEPKVPECCRAAAEEWMFDPGETGVDALVEILVRTHHHRPDESARAWAERVGLEVYRGIHSYGDPLDDVVTALTREVAPFFEKPAVDAEAMAERIERAVEEYLSATTFQIPDNSEEDRKAVRAVIASEVAPLLVELTNWREAHQEAQAVVERRDAEIAALKAKLAEAESWHPSRKGKVPEGEA